MTDETQNQPTQTRAVRVPEKFTQRFIIGADAEGNTKDAEGKPLYGVVHGPEHATLVDRILQTEPTPRGRGGMTREITVTREEYQQLYSLLANARRYMQNVDKEEGKRHRANTLAAAVGADAAANRMEKDAIWGIDNPIPYVPKRKRKAQNATPTTSTNDGASDSTADDTSNDGDLSSSYTPATVDTADDTSEVDATDAGFIQQDVANG